MLRIEIPKGFRNRCLRAGLGVIPLLLGAGCAELPVREMEAARLRVEIARREGAVRYASEALAASEGTLLAGRKEMARQGRRFVWFRDYTRARNLASKAGQDALTAREMAAQNRLLARKAAEQAMDKAASALEIAQSVVERMPLDRRGHSQVAAARVSLAEAEHLYKKEDYASVQQRVGNAIEAMDGVRTRIDAQIRSYSQYQERWRRWVDETLAWSNHNSAHAVVVDKVNHRADLYYDGRLKKRYQVDLGMSWLGDKVRRGDNATPEGKYRVVRKMGPSETRYYRALLLNYPNDDDRRQFQDLKRRGQISGKADIGGSIEIHGHGGRGTDWTQGCVALSNNDMDDLCRYVGVGTPITIVGYRAEASGVQVEKPDLSGKTDLPKSRRQRRG